MLITTIYGGMVSQIRAFYIAYRMSVIKQDKLILDLSQYYNGYYQPYLLDYLKVPDIEKIMIREKREKRVDFIYRIYGKEPILLTNGEELENAYNEYRCEEIYYIVNDCCEYDSFCMLHREFFFRYVGDDNITKQLTEMMQLRKERSEFKQLIGRIESQESVGVHIRLRDFVKIGWMVQKDYSFYKAAIQWFRQRLDNAKFYIFSDDISSARKILGESMDIEYVKLCGGYVSDVEEFICLSRCKHKILTKKSGYSLYSAALSQNNGNKDGYTLIIERMNLSDNAANQTYIEDNFNKNLGCHRNEDLCNCIELNENDIEYLNAIYNENNNFVSQNFEQALWKCQCETEENSLIKQECERIYKSKYNQYAIQGKELTFLFITLQTYSEINISEMEKMAYLLAVKGFEVHFVGRKVNFLDELNSELNWTMNNVKIATDNNGESLGYYLYPYNELKEKKCYFEFIKEIAKKVDTTMITIVRKFEALPPKEEHCNYNCKFVFIDFTDLCMTENYQQYSDSEIEYLYENADLSITFELKQYYKWSKKLGKNIQYIDISQLYPVVMSTLSNIQSPLHISCKEESVYTQIYNVIKSRFC